MLTVTYFNATNTSFYCNFYSYKSDINVDVLYLH